MLATAHSLTFAHTVYAGTVHTTHTKKCYCQVLTHDSKFFEERVKVEISIREEVPTHQVKERVLVPPQCQVACPLLRQHLRQARWSSLLPILKGSYKRPANYEILYAIIHDCIKQTSNEDLKNAT